MRHFVLLASVLTLGLAACAGETSDEANGTQDAISGSALPSDVVAIDIAADDTKTGKDDVVSIAAKEKVQNVVNSVHAFKKGTIPPSCGRMGPTARLTLRDKDGESLGTVSYKCSFGQANLKSGAKFDVMVDSVIVSKEAAKDLLPADILFGVDTVTITKPTAASKMVTVTKEADVAEILESIDGDTLDTKSSDLKCLPLYVVKFLRSKKEVASLTFKCTSATPLPKTINGSFSSIGSRGASKYLGMVPLKTGPIDKAFTSAK